MVSVEAIFWIPLFFTVTLFVIDASFLFTRHALATRIVHEGNRYRSVTGFDTTADAEAWIKSQIADFAPNATVAAVEDTTEHVITTTASMPASDLLFTKAFASFVNLTITISASHQIEY